MSDAAQEDRIQMMAKQRERTATLRANLSSFEKDRRRISAENSDLSFQLILNYLRQSGESSKSTCISKIQETDQQMAKKVEAFAYKVNELEMRNQNLTEFTASKENEVEFLKQEL